MLQALIFHCSFSVVFPCSVDFAAIQLPAKLSLADVVNLINSQRVSNRNLGISRAPLQSQAHLGTSLFTSAD